MNTEQTRSKKPGWTVIAEGDNGIDLLQFIFKVADFDEATQLGAKIAALITKHERPDVVYDTQVALRDWRVEVQLALPKGTWGTIAQQKLTDAVVLLSI